jgi:HEPN domain-containing protein
MGRASPTDTVCFHAHQCVEKYLKALLTARETRFERTHDIQALVSLLPERIRPPVSIEDQAMLSDYAVTTRYPGDYEPITLVEARRAVQIARRVRRDVRRRLPNAVL